MIVRVKAKPEAAVGFAGHSRVQNHGMEMAKGDLETSSILIFI